MVYQKLTRLLAPRIGLYFGVMLAFAGVTALLGETQAAVAELIVVGVLLIACGASALRRKQEADRYLKELMDSMDQATRDSTLNCPLPDRSGDVPPGYRRGGVVQRPLPAPHRRPGADV